jgi:DNA mismatch repair protein MutS2
LNELKNLDWNSIIHRLTGFATSEVARERLAALAPLASADIAQTYFSQIMQMSNLVQQGLRPHMESLDLFAPWYQRLIRNAVLKPLELKDVRHFSLETLALSEALREYKTPYLSELRSRLMAAEEPLSAIDQIMTAGGDILSDASEKLHHLNVEKTGLGRQVQIILDRIVKDFQIEYLLQDRFVTTREGRWVLPIKGGMQHGFQGIVHASSQTKQTVFMEPQEVVPLNNRLREIEIEIEAEIERLLTELSTYLSTLRFEFEKTRETLLEADQCLAKSELTIHLKAQPCEFSSQHFHLTDVRHPLLALSTKPVVTNSVELTSDRRILLLSGPNAGGKTVLLKAIGLAAQMARCGLPICVREGSKIPFFKDIVVAIGDSQSVDADLSTFAAHLKKLDEAAQCKGPDTLLLIDEICGSTDPEEGAALARAFIEAYRENQTFAVITSHLGALKHGWKPESGVINGSLDFDKSSGPTYRFIMGVPGQSLAIQTAKRAGISPTIIQGAITNMSPESRKFEDSIEEVERMKQDVLKLQDLLNKELKQTTKEKDRYAEMIEEFNAQRESRLDKEVKAANQKLDEMIKETHAKNIFRRHESLEKIKFELPTVIKASSSTAGLKKSGGPLTSADDFEKSFPAGSSVHIPSLGRDGIVQGRPNSKGEVPVLSNSMRMTIPWQSLQPSRQSQNPTQRVLRQSGHFGHSPADEDRVVDLRGLTSEDAISQLEIQLDTASLGQEDRVKIVHGHGTDALKRAIRSYLSRSVYVKKWHAGTPESGGDGITWIELN